MSETAASYIAARENAVTPTVRRPRVRAMVDGVELGGLFKANITTDGFYKADHFSATFALYADGAKSLDFWSSATELLLDIQIQFEGERDWQSFIVGEADHINVNPTQGTVDLDGRDLSARFIETKTQESFQNKTASEIVTILAARHNETFGITANVTATTTPVSRYYQIDHTQETAGQFSRVTNEWDLLVYLAQREDFDLYMQGRVLHFHPKRPKDLSPFAVSWKQTNPLPVSNVIDLRMERSLTLAKDIEVEVRSWNSKQAQSLKKVARAIGAKSAGASAAAKQRGTETQRYVIIRPNLTEAQAQDLANLTLAELSAHERNISWTMPGEFDLNARRQCRLTGTASSWDQVYFIDSVQREISFDGGFMQHVHAKNHSVDSQALV